MLDDLARSRETQGLMCFYVDDVMISGPKGDPDFKRMLDKVRCLYEWGEWEQHEFDQCGCRARQATDRSVTVDQELRKISIITMSAHRRKHMSETLSAEEHTTLMAKTRRAEQVSNTIHDSTVSTSESHRHIENCHRQSLKNVNRLVRQAHCEASDKLHYLVISDPVFVSFADASWANRKDFGSQCGYLCVGKERSLLDGSAAPCCLVSWHSRRCPRVARSSGSAETQAATQSQEETEFIRLLWLDIVQGGYDDTIVQGNLQGRRLSHH